MKVKVLVAGLALVAAGNASALIAPGADSTGELFLSVWDKTAQVSYSQDLNIDLSQFLTNSSAGGFNANASWSLALSPAWGSFFNAANASSIVYNVAASDLGNLKLNNLDQTYGYLSSFKTSNAAPVPANNVAVVSAPGQAIAAKAGTYNNDPADAETYGPTNAGYYATAWGNNIDSQVPNTQNSEGLFNQVVNAVFHGISSTLATDPDTGDFFVTDRFDVLAGQFKLTATSLEYTVAPTTTVPVPAAAWLFGAALTTLIGANRRKSVVPV